MKAKKAKYIKWYRIFRIWANGRLKLAKRMDIVYRINFIYGKVANLHDKYCNDILLFGSSQINEKDFENEIHKAQQYLYKKITK